MCALGTVKPLNNGHTGTSHCGPCRVGRGDVLLVHGKTILYRELHVVHFSFRLHFYTSTKIQKADMILVYVYA